ncbi:VOC family protein [Maliponia aquimaris]|uniref:3-demethylubiquinone-9 3-methyltransferase n=1 Tax=Maliponia aquimaris TaxID=1673631 RepID=A0A238K383_9RHOB|nr:VOC family protein [Maliponia aquimaris]SMX36406.1 3-demethylubiquinone-9 3-methyltransferase [Maliponia aquimaris]
MPMSKVATCLWFEKEGLEAARFYCALIPESEIAEPERFDNMLTGEVDAVLVIDFTLGGAPFQILQAGPHQAHTDMVSISVTTEDQAETDRLWAALTADGGQESQCGWLIDRWGIRWQITLRQLTELTARGDKRRTNAMMQAMMGMTRLDMAALEAAYDAG